MSLTDEEMDGLEEYLDGAMTPTEADALRRQIATDSAWAIALDQLKQLRQVRLQMFANLEPDESTADQWTDRILQAARREHTGEHTGEHTDKHIWNRFGRVFRLGSAAAACISLGVLGGWILRERSHPVAPINTAAVVSHEAIHASTQVAQVVAYEVKLTDEAGRVTAVQRFDSLEKAREFADDLSQWQQRQRQVRDGGAVVVADKF